MQGFSALSGSPGARAYYDSLRARKIGHHAALRQLAHRLVGILHGCLKRGTKYDERTAWQIAMPPRLDRMRHRADGCLVSLSAWRFASGQPEEQGVGQPSNCGHDWA